MKIQFYQFIALLALLCYFLPITIVLAKKLWRDKAVLLFSLYWMAQGLVNLLDRIPGVNTTTIETIGVVYNMIDIPLILAICHFTSKSFFIRNFIRLFILPYLLLVGVTVFFNGITHAAIKYTIGGGLIIVLTVLIVEILRYFQKVVHSNRERSLLFIYCALLFEYGTYVIIYIFEYFIPATNPVDNYLIYYISSVIAIIISCIGFLSRKSKKVLRFTDYQSFE